MSRPPQISVALPVYNGADYLEDALESVLAQDFADWELVVSDNGSTDATAEILAHYAASDSRIRVFRIERPVGQVENVNRCVELCSADWVQFLCHDDLFFPGALRRLADEIGSLHGSCVALVGHSTALLYGGKWWVDYLAHHDKKPRQFERADFLQQNERPVMASQRFIGPSVAKAICERRLAPTLPALTTAMVRREALLGMGGFEAGYMHFDLFAWMQLLTEYDYCSMPQALTLTRIHGRQVAVDARKSLRSITDHERFWKLFFDKNGSQLHLGWRARLCAIFRPINIAAGILGTEWKRGGVRCGLWVLGKLPPSYWPWMPILVFRFRHHESRRIGPLLKVLDVSEIYP